MARRMLPFAARTESTMSNSPTRPAKGQARVTCSMRLFLRSPCPFSFPRRIVASGLFLPFGTLSAPPPRPRGGWSADRRTLCYVARARRDLRALRRGLSRSERDLSRRSTMAIFGRGPTPPPPGVKDRSRQRLVRKPQGLAEGSLASRGSGSRRNRGDATPRSAFRIVSGDALHERGWRIYTMAALRSQ